MKLLERGNPLFSFAVSSSHATARVHNLLTFRTFFVQKLPLCNLHKKSQKSFDNITIKKFQLFCKNLLTSPDLYDIISHTIKEGRLQSNRKGIKK